MKIIIEINGKEETLSMEDAARIYYELKKVVECKNPSYPKYPPYFVPSYPFNPWELPIVTCRPLVTTVTTSGTMDKN